MYRYCYHLSFHSRRFSSSSNIRTNCLEKKETLGFMIQNAYLLSLRQCYVGEVTEIWTTIVVRTSSSDSLTTLLLEAVSETVKSKQWKSYPSNVFHRSRVILNIFCDMIFQTHKWFCHTQSANFIIPNSWDSSESIYLITITFTYNWSLTN